MSTIGYAFTPEEQQAIEDAKKSALRKKEKIWDQPELVELKARLKAHVRNAIGERCCYCAKTTDDEHNIALDIEHVLPKHKYQAYEFVPFNLSVSCKRCNMRIKGIDDSFVVDTTLTNPKADERENYRFIHPNFDVYFDHLLYLAVTINQYKIFKYTVLNDSDKGNYTYQYFELKKIEQSAMNTVQGAMESIESLSQKIPPDMKARIRELLGD